MAAPATTATAPLLVSYHLIEFLIIRLKSAKSIQPTICRLPGFYRAADVIAGARYAFDVLSWRYNVGAPMTFMRDHMVTEQKEAALTQLRQLAVFVACTEYPCNDVEKRCLRLTPERVACAIAWLQE